MHSYYMRSYVYSQLYACMRATCLTGLWDTFSGDLNILVFLGVPLCAHPKLKIRETSAEESLSRYVKKLLTNRYKCSQVQCPHDSHRDLGNVG